MKFYVIFGRHIEDNKKIYKAVFTITEKTRIKAALQAVKQANINNYYDQFKVKPIIVDDTEIELLFN